MRIGILLIKIGNLLCAIIYFGFALFAIIGGFYSMLYLFSIKDASGILSILPVSVGFGLIWLWKLDKEEQTNKHKIKVK